MKLFHLILICLPLAIYVFSLPEDSIQDPISSLLFCDQNNRPTSCNYGIAPVCASIAKCTESPSCQYTAGNNCTACLDPSVALYTLGSCQKEQAPIESFCKINVEKAENAPSDTLKEPVCAVLSECYGDECYQPAESGESACLEPNVISYITGNCPTTAEPRKTVCDPDNRPGTCGTRTQHVCAFFREDIEGPRYQTLPSPCYACLDERVESYIPGICLEDLNENKNFCDIDNLPRPCPPPPSDYFNPVCAFIRNCTEEPCSYTVGYSCVACGVGIGVDYFIQGPCKVFCDSKTIEEFCSQDSGEVCAFIKGCTGDDCKKTVENSCVACSDAEIEYYTDGRECRPIEFPEELPLGPE